MDLAGEEGHRHDDLTMEEEFRRAALEKRQPQCIYCQEPLQVAQRVEEQIVWYWNASDKAYEKMHTLVDRVEPPYCISCQTPDPTFVGNSLVHY